MSSGATWPRLVVDDVGSVMPTEVIWEPWRLVDPRGAVVGPVTQFLQDLQASGRSAATQRSYALDLLRWFRFLWAVEVEWRKATRCEARDFCRWLALVDKLRRTGGRRVPVGAANPVTGKRSPGSRYAASTLAHSETVLRTFYDFHLEAGSGPMINPFPLVRERAGFRAHAHHNPMEPFRNERSGRYRPLVAQRVPRRIPDERVRPALRPVALRPGSGANRVLGLHWCAGRGAAGGAGWGCRSGPAADHGGSEGVAGGAAAAGQRGRLRLAAALPDLAGRDCPGRGG
jgi:hypothetical protein